MNLRKAVAYHEAGHAVVSYLLCIRFEYITCDPAMGADGHLQPKVDWFDKQYYDSLPTRTDEVKYYATVSQANSEKAFNLLQVYLAGAHAQLLSGELLHDRQWRDDKLMASHLAFHLGLTELDAPDYYENYMDYITNREKQEDSLYNRAREAARRLVHENSKMIAALSSELESRGVMSEDEVLTFLANLNTK